MLAIVNEVKTLLTMRPSKYTIMMLAILGAMIGLQLFASAHAGRPIDASH